MPTTAPHRPARPDQELLPEDTPLGRYVWVNPARMSGEPCFRNTRVPVQTLFDHLRFGDSFDVFMNDFPGVTREQIVGVIDLTGIGLLGGLRQLAGLPML